MCPRILTPFGQKVKPATAFRESCDHFVTQKGQPTGCPFCVDRCPLKRFELLDRDLGTGAFEGFLRLICGLLVDLLQDCCGSRLNQILGFFEAEAGQ